MTKPKPKFRGELPGVSWPSHRAAAGREYTVYCLFRQRTSVTIPAADEAEAIAKFKAGEFDWDEACVLAEIIDWENVGPPELNK